jgi:hypothetical protein
MHFLVPKGKKNKAEQSQSCLPFFFCLKSNADVLCIPLANVLNPPTHTKWWCHFPQTNFLPMLVPSLNYFFHNIAILKVTFYFDSLSPLSMVSAKLRNFIKSRYELHLVHKVRE